MDDPAITLRASPHHRMRNTPVHRDGVYVDICVILPVELVDYGERADALENGVLVLHRIDGERKTRRMGNETSTDEPPQRVIVGPDGRGGVRRNEAATGAHPFDEGARRLVRNAGSVLKSVVRLLGGFHVAGIQYYDVSPSQIKEVVRLVRRLDVEAVSAEKLAYERLESAKIMIMSTENEKQVFLRHECEALVRGRSDPKIRALPLRIIFASGR